MSDLLMQYLKKHGIHPNRKQYIKANTMGDENGDEVLDGENEAELPEHLQVNSKMEAKSQKPKSAGILAGLAGKDE